MPDLIWLEWEKCPDGYSLETLRGDYLIPSDKADSESKQTWTTGKPKDDAPMWVHTLLRQSREGGASAFIGLNDEQFIIPRSDRVTRFRPLDGNNSAFMELADCADSASNLLRFVSQYGFLNQWEESTDQFQYDIYWVGNIMEDAEFMRDGVNAWKIAQKTGDFTIVRELFNWGRPADRGSEDDDPYPDYKDSGDEILVHLDLMLRRSHDPKGLPILSLVPKDLDHGLWLQFAQAISSDISLQHCAVCPAWFAYGTGTGKRKSAQYCSDRCRKAAHRLRKEAEK